MSTSFASALVALGANQPHAGRSPLESLKMAVSCMQDAGFELEAMSSFFTTPAWPPGSGPEYVNAAAVIRVPADLTPEVILSRLHAIEATLGRVRETRWASRSVDIDLIAMGDQVRPDASVQRAWMELAPARQGVEAPEALILPHPRLQDRAFVLVPLAEIAPDWRHPLLGATIVEMRDALPEADLRAVVPL